MRITKLIVSICVLVVGAMGADTLFATPATTAYAASPTNCGTQKTTVSSPNLASALSTNVNALMPNSCFERAFTACSPATLVYDVKDPSTSFGVQLAVQKPVAGGCAVSASVYGLSMTCTLNNKEALTDSLVSTVSQKYDNCNGLLKDLLPKNVNIPATVVTAADVHPASGSAPATNNSPQPVAPTASASATNSSSPLPNTGAGEVAIPIFVISSVLGALGYRKFQLRAIA